MICAFYEHHNHTPPHPLAPGISARWLSTQKSLVSPRGSAAAPLPPSCSASFADSTLSSTSWRACGWGVGVGGCKHVVGQEGQGEGGKGREGRWAGEFRKVGSRGAAVYCRHSVHFSKLHLHGAAGQHLPSQYLRCTRTHTHTYSHMRMHTHSK